jgi:hypothetical protein
MTLHSNSNRNSNIQGATQAAPPRIGELYLQLGVRLVVIDVTDTHVYLTCRAGRTPAPLVACTIERFQLDLAAGHVIPDVEAA